MTTDAILDDLAARLEAEAVSMPVCRCQEQLILTAQAWRGEAIQIRERAASFNERKHRERAMRAATRALHEL